jgi:hypothetical protein
MGKPTLTVKFLSIDRFSTRTITPSEIAPLEHEIFDHTVKLGALVSNSLSIGILEAHCQLTEVIACLGNGLVIELENDALRGGATD